VTGTVNLLDTNIVIGLLDERPQVLQLKARFNFTFETIAISQITRIELLSFWNLGPVEEQKIRSFLAACRVLPVDDAVEAATIALRRRTPLKLPDAIIGATAQVHGLRLVTLDARLEAAVHVPVPPGPPGP
jgi:predicted nucleic acid-binding protein